MLNCSISFAKSVTTVTDSTINTINSSRKFLLFNKTSTWVEKGNNSLFELVKLSLLNRWSTVVDQNVAGLYRGDELDAISNANCQKLDRIRTAIIALFKEKGLPIPIKTNPIETDFVGATFNLATNKYFPFRRTIYNKLLYIDALSYHLVTIIKQFLKINNK